MDQDINGMVSQPNLLQTKMGTNHFKVTHWFIPHYSDIQILLLSSLLHDFQGVKRQLITFLPIFFPDWSLSIVLSIIVASQDDIVKLAFKRLFLDVAVGRIPSSQLLVFLPFELGLLLLVRNIHWTSAVTSSSDFLQYLAQLYSWQSRPDCCALRVSIISVFERRSQSTRSLLWYQRHRVAVSSGCLTHLNKFINCLKVIRYHCVQKGFFIFFCQPQRGSEYRTTLWL